MEEDRVKRLEDLIEGFRRDNKWDDREIQEALLIVSKNHIWKQGLFARIKFYANLIGALGILGGIGMLVVNFFGWEAVRR